MFTNSNAQLVIEELDDPPQSSSQQEKDISYSDYNRVNSTNRHFVEESKLGSTQFLGMQSLEAKD